MVILSLSAASAYAGVSIQGGTFQTKDKTSRIEIGSKNIATETDQLAFSIKFVRDGDIITDSGIATLGSVQK